MRKLALTGLVIVALASVAAAEEYGAWVVKADGQSMNAFFVRQTGTTITLRVDGQTYNYNTGEIGLVVFNNDYTDFSLDEANKSRANPHLLVQKNGDVLGGNLTAFTPGGKMTMVVSSRLYTYDAVTAARIYYNIHAFFASVTVTGKNTIATGGEEEEEEKEKEKKGKREKKNGKKGKDKKETYEAMVGGQVFIRMKNGATTTGLIYDVMGTGPTLVLTDGRRINIPNIDIINYQSTQHNYPGDKRKIKVGGATFIMRNGAVASGVVYDYRGEDPYWELTDGRRIMASQVARIYFR